MFVKINKKIFNVTDNLLEMIKKNENKILSEAGNIAIADNEETFDAMLCKIYNDVITQSMKQKYYDDLSEENKEIYSIIKPFLRDDNRFKSLLKGDQKNKIFNIYKSAAYRSWFDFKHVLANNGKDKEIEATTYDTITDICRVILNSVLKIADDGCEQEGIDFNEKMEPEDIDNLFKPISNNILKVVNDVIKRTKSEYHNSQNNIKNKVSERIKVNQNELNKNVSSDISTNKKNSYFDIIDQGKNEIGNDEIADIKNKGLNTNEPQKIGNDKITYTDWMNISKDARLLDRISKKLPETMEKIRQMIESRIGTFTMVTNNQLNNPKQSNQTNTSVQNVQAKTNNQQPMNNQTNMVQTESAKFGYKKYVYEKPILQELGIPTGIKKLATYGVQGNVIQKLSDDKNFTDAKLWKVMDESMKHIDNEPMWERYNKVKKIDNTSNENIWNNDGRLTKERKKKIIEGYKQSLKNICYKINVGDKRYISDIVQILTYPDKPFINFTQADIIPSTARVIDVDGFATRIFTYRGQNMIQAHESIQNDKGKYVGFCDPKIVQNQDLSRKEYINITTDKFMKTIIDDTVSIDPSLTTIIYRGKKDKKIYGVKIERYYSETSKNKKFVYMYYDIYEKKLVRMDNQEQGSFNSNTKKQPEEIFNEHMLFIKDKVFLDKQGKSKYVNDPIDKVFDITQYYNVYERNEESVDTGYSTSGTLLILTLVIVEAFRRGKAIINTLQSLHNDLNNRNSIY